MATQDDTAAVRRVNGDVLDNVRARLAQADANVQQTAITLAHAVQLQAVQETALGFESHIAQFTERLFRLGTGAAEAVTTVNHVAASSSALAAATTSSMATAAGSINAAAKAVDDYLREIAGLAELVDNEARDTSLSAHAKKVLHQARDISATTDRLRQHALKANVLSATARAEAAQQSAADTAQKIQSLANLAQQAFSAASTSRADLIKSAASAAEAASSAMEAYVMNSLSAKGSGAMVDKVNTVANAGLRARQMTADELSTSGQPAAPPPSAKQPSTSIEEDVSAALEDFEVNATVSGAKGASGTQEQGSSDASSPVGIIAELSSAAATPSAASDASDGGYYFFVVSSHQQYSFHFADAQALVETQLRLAARKQAPGATPAPPAVVFSSTQTAKLLLTVDGSPLGKGSYVVFALRASTPQGPFSEADFSLPSNVVVPVQTLSITAVAPTAVAPTPASKDGPAVPAPWVSVGAQCDALPTGSDVVMRCCLVRWDVWNTLSDSAASTLYEQPAAFFKQQNAVAKKPLTFGFGEDDLDAFGDLLQSGVHYVPVCYAQASSTSSPTSLPVAWASLEQAPILWQAPAN